MDATATMLLGMFVTLVTLIVASIWNQHRENNAMRAENTRQIERLSDQVGKQLGTLGKDLSGVRERLGRIEGYLGLLSPPTAEEPGNGDHHSDT